MKVLGIIAEYNPFHMGHLYHLEESLRVSGATHTVAVMSGNFVQRGEPSIVDKWTRAEMAVENGIDLVLEMPAVFATSSAEYFGKAGIGLLDSLGIVDIVSYGSETGSSMQLESVADLLVDESSLFVESLKENLSLGLSFPKAREKAIESIRPDLAGTLNNSNNILAIEYHKAAMLLGSKMRFISVKRRGSAYNEKELGEGSFSSATSIRNSMHSNGLESVRGSLPNASFSALEMFHEHYGMFPACEDLFDYVLYKARISDSRQIRMVEGIREGMENRLKAASYQYRDYDSLVDAVSSKRYPRSSIQRVLLHMLMNLEKSQLKEYSSCGDHYARVLGFNSKGRELLGRIKSVSDVELITNVNRQKAKGATLDRMLLYDRKSTDLYMLLLKRGGKLVLENQDSVRKPYIKI